VKRLAFWYA